MGYEDKNNIFDKDIEVRLNFISEKSVSIIIKQKNDEGEDWSVEISNMDEAIKIGNKIISEALEIKAKQD